MRLTGSQEKNFLRHIINRSKRIQEKPRLYNTLFSNCTNELAKAARLDWKPAFVITGTAADTLHGMGLISERSVSDFENVRQKAIITDVIKELNGSDPEQFDSALLEIARRRWF